MANRPRNATLLAGLVAAPLIASPSGRVLALRDLRVTNLREAEPVDYTVFLGDAPLIGSTRLQPGATDVQLLGGEIVVPADTSVKVACSRAEGARAWCSAIEMDDRGDLRSAASVAGPDGLDLITVPAGAIVAVRDLRVSMVASDNEDLGFWARIDGLEFVATARLSRGDPTRLLIGQGGDFALLPGQVLRVGATVADGAAFVASWLQLADPDA